MRLIASFPIHKKENSMTSSARTGKRERISNLHRIGGAMCELISETSTISADLPASAISLKVCSALPAEAPAGGEPDLQLAVATWKPRSVSPSKRHTAAQPGPLLYVAPTESRSRYASTYRPACRTENSSISQMRARLAQAAPLRETFS